MGFTLTGSPLGHSMGSTPELGRTLSSKLLQHLPLVFVVDPDRAVRESLQSLLQGEGWHPETFASAEEFLTRPVEAAPACLILDTSLPGLSGLELQKRVAATCPHIPVLFLSGTSDIPTTVEAMKAGAVEFLTKPFLEIELVIGVREALDRSRLVIARKAEKQALQGCFASLSPRQQQVMALVSSGLPNKRVAMELGISEITVKAHRGQVMQRMQAGSLADLVKMAGKLGLIRRLKAPTFTTYGDRPPRQDSPLLANYAFSAALATH